MTSSNGCALFEDTGRAPWVSPDWPTSEVFFPHLTHCDALVHDKFFKSDRLGVNERRLATCDTLFTHHK